jgi:hypothetical protein
MSIDARAADAAPPAARGALSLTAVGLGVAGLAAALDFFTETEQPGWAAALAVTFAVLGLVTAGLGVSRRPKDAGVLALAAGAAFLAYFGIHPAWDSVRLAAGVAGWIAAFAAVVVLLPPLAQKVAVSLMLLYHFAGILTAITSPPTSPWMTGQLWTRFFRPHLLFSYVNNAYQFYSPQPGPASLLWFCVELGDGTKTWYKLPRRPETHLDPLAVEYFRRLSLTEQANQNVPLPTGPPELALKRRFLRPDIPMHPELPWGMQFRLTSDHSQRLVRSYARYVAQGYGGPANVRSVMVYRVEHRMLGPKEFVKGDDPFDPSTYWPYYLGEYEPKPTPDDPGNFELKAADAPLRFWLIPIIREPRAAGPGKAGAEYTYRNWLEYHAGSDPFED